ncbi:hypothetical protein C8Q76DRAFT_180380 [Earliella scabrosa]|nr:hypothetical protein C8Q76DRAFT_180380 [Earliella scabrosa]
MPVLRSPPASPLAVMFHRQTSQQRPSSLCCAASSAAASSAPAPPPPPSAPSPQEHPDSTRGRRAPSTKRPWEAGPTGSNDKSITELSTNNPIQLTDWVEDKNGRHSHWKWHHDQRVPGSPTTLTGDSTVSIRLPEMLEGSATRLTPRTSHRARVPVMSRRGLNAALWSRAHALSQSVYYDVYLNHKSFITPNRWPGVTIPLHAPLTAVHFARRHEHQCARMVMPVGRQDYIWTLCP